MLGMSARQLLVASANPGKLREIRALLPADIGIVGLDELGIASPEETGATLRENADLKALHAARASGMLALADDSGLEVEALSGAPGVRSARYAGEPPDDAKNRKALLAAMAGVPHGRRNARFVSEVTIATPEGIIGTSRGVLDGTILDRERGSRGFGYDPIFLLPDGRTVAELLDEEKNAMSHRSAAIRAILPQLQQALGESETRQALLRSLSQSLVSPVAARCPPTSPIGGPASIVSGSPQSWL
jgi:XTP/dITP diphosphohydrolase